MTQRWNLSRAVMTAIVRSPIGRLMPGVGLIRYRAADQRLITLPVGIAAGSDGALMVTVGAASKKTWWHHFRAPAAADVFHDGKWVPMTGVLDDVITDDTRHVRLAA